MKISGGANKRPKRNTAPAREAKIKKEKPRKAGTGGASVGKKIGITAAIIAGVLIAGFFGIGAVANRTELIYSKVSMEGVDLSGKTLPAAADALAASSFGTGEDKELFISMPADIDMVVSAKEAGCFMSAADAAVFAYDYCHGGGFLQNTITYLKCLFGGAELSIGDGAALNEDYLHRVVTDAARRVQLALLDANIEIGETEITVIKGASSVQIDTEQLFEDVRTALVAGKFEPLEYNTAAANATVEEIDLEKLYDTVFLEPINAVYDPETKGATQSQDGRSFDIAEARRLWDTTAPGDRVVIPLIITVPEISTETLNGMLFADLLAQKSTTLSGSSYARINNIKKACEAISGLVMNPGDEFSYNGVVGERTKSKGFMEAGAYNNGQVVQEVGGGICQVSSTIYYCALISNLEITNRLCHYFGVAYLPAGLDATVSWPAPDFKFKNNGTYPIRIEAYVDSDTNSCVIKIYGSNPDGIKVEMTTEPLYYADGYGAVSYRWVYDRDGNLISKKEEARSRYYYHVDDEEEEEESPSPSPETSTSPEVSPTTSPEVTTPTPSLPVSPSEPVTSSPEPTPTLPPPEGPVTP